MTEIIQAIFSFQSNLTRVSIIEAGSKTPEEYRVCRTITLVDKSSIGAACNKQSLRIIIF